MNIPQRSTWSSLHPSQESVCTSMRLMAPRETDIIKLIMDAISFGAGTEGDGGVVRSSSRLMEDWSKLLLGVTDTFIAEAMSIREFIIFTKIGCGWMNSPLIMLVFILCGIGCCYQRSNRKLKRVEDVGGRNDAANSPLILVIFTLVFILCGIGRGL